MPELRPPPGSTDCHIHIYGPFARFPAAQEGPFTPTNEFPVEKAFELWSSSGLERGVIVHAAGAGDDNRVTLDALRRFPDRLRATALLSPDVSDRRLDELTEAGFRAVRVAMMPARGGPPSNSGATYE